MSISKRGKLRKIHNLADKCVAMMQQSYDYALMADGQYITASGVDVPARLLPTFASTSAERAKQAGEYAKTAAHRLFALYPELRVEE